MSFFDCATSTSGIHCVPEKTDQQYLVRNFNRFKCTVVIFGT